MWTRLGFPPLGDHRRFVGSLAIDALGSGIWLPMSLLYFLKVADITLVQLGVVMTAANVVVMPLVPLVGRVVDAMGPKRVMLWGNLLQGCSFLIYPWADAPWEIGMVVGAATLGRTMFWGSNGPMITTITERGERELWFGFVQAMRNAGYGVGGVLSAVALQIGSAASYHAVVLANAASFFVAYGLLWGTRGGEAAPAHERESIGWGDVVRDRPYLLLVAVIFAYAMTETTLNVVMPVYFIERLGLSGWVPGAVFVINTVMIGLGQGLVIRGIKGFVRYRVVLCAVGFSATSFVLMYAASALTLMTATCLVLVGAVVYTVGEMVAGPVLGALSAEAAPDAGRGRYMSLTQLSWNFSSAIAPALWACLLAVGSGTAWGVAIAITAVWALGVLALPRALPRAAQTVTNRAEQAVVAD